MQRDHIAALERAITLAGSQAALAKGIAEFLDRPTVSQQTISYWVTNEVLLDPEWWPAIEHVTRNEVRREDLRPDVFKRSNVA